MGTLAGVAALALGGCSALGTLFGPDAVVKVAEVANTGQCGAASGDTTVQMFANADAVLAWQATSGVTLLGEQSMLPGGYALVQMGQRGTGGYGVVVAPEAEVDDGVLRLHATFLDPPRDAVLSQALSSPCALVRLPVGDWRGVEVYGQNGRRLARATPR
ncbi:protease complex subunit PrcB family protein [Solimonas soli]|uniref:protease complex subunit PrcB family protein n=1 Tax=Solimonas soli TaxID=413479 RepID=UPI0004AF7755